MHFDRRTLREQTTWWRRQKEGNIKCIFKVTEPGTVTFRCKHDNEPADRLSASQKRILLHEVDLFFHIVIKYLPYRHIKGKGKEVNLCL